MQYNHEELLEDISLKLTFDLNAKSQQEQDFCALAAVKLTKYVERNNLVAKWQAVVNKFIAIYKKNKTLTVFDVMAELSKQQQALASRNNNVQP